MQVRLYNLIIPIIESLLIVQIIVNMEKITIYRRFLNQKVIKYSEINTIKIRKYCHSIAFKKTEFKDNYNRIILYHNNVFTFFEASDEVLCEIITYVRTINSNINIINLPPKVKSLKY